MVLKILKYVGLSIASLMALLIALFIGLESTFDPRELPENYAKVDAELFLGKAGKQPLIVYFGGSEGGNSWTKAHNINERQKYLEQGYAALAIGYFGLPGIPKHLDRISLDAIYQAIEQASRHPRIDANCVVVMGGSKGAELALTLASKYPQIKAAVSLAGSHVVYAGTSMFADGKTASFMFNDEQLPSVPFPIEILPAMLMGDLRGAYEIALKNTDAVEKARIAVENIQGPVLLVSGEKDHIWPSAEMSEEVIARLESNQFDNAYQHIVVPNGDHFQPQNDYHPQVIAFLNEHFLPACERSQIKQS